ncbi:MAG TPA: acyl-CoA carboxylase epsilon subunit [Actinocrinis sp.]|nr:acyl-CoA carboxylase epsilon subunit [Actinocrinis sp.]
MTEPALIRIVRGEPTAEELAALLGVLAAAGSAPDEQPSAAPASGWTDRSRYVRGPLAPAANGWRAAAFPR